MFGVLCEKQSLDLDKCDASLSVKQEQRECE